MSEQVMTAPPSLYDAFLGALVRDNLLPPDARGVALESLRRALSPRVWVVHYHTPHGYEMEAAFAEKAEAEKFVCSYLRWHVEQDALMTPNQGGTFGWRILFLLARKQWEQAVNVYNESWSHRKDDGSLHLWVQEVGLLAAAEDVKYQEVNFDGP